MVVKNYESTSSFDKVARRENISNQIRLYGRAFILVHTRVSERSTWTWTQPPSLGEIVSSFHRFHKFSPRPHRDSFDLLPTP